MKLLEILKARRSVRQFLDKEVEQEKINAIIEGVMTAPSSKNTRTTRLAVVRDRETLTTLSQMRDYGSALLAKAPVAIIVMAEEEPTDLWRENCSISATIMQLMAEEEGLGSCWVHVCDRAQQLKNPEAGDAETFVKEKFPALKPYRVHCIVAIGYDETRPKPHKERDQKEIIIEL